MSLLNKLIEDIGARPEEIEKYCGTYVAVRNRQIVASNRNREILETTLFTTGLKKGEFIIYDLSKVHVIGRQTE